MYELKVDNFDKIIKGCERYPKTIGREMEATTKKVGLIVLNREKREVPVGTGALRRSIVMKYRPIQMTIAPTLNYAVFVHEGTGIYGKRKQHIVPKRAKVLAWKKGGKWIVAKKTKGQKPNKFVERTVEATKTRINNEFSKTVDKVINAI